MGRRGVLGGAGPEVQGPEARSATTSSSTPTIASSHQWLAVTTTIAVVSTAWPAATTASHRGPVRATTYAISTAQPTWRLGMAANWLATSALAPSYGEGPKRVIVSTNPSSGNIRGGASGNSVWMASAAPVWMVSRLRAHRYSARERRAKPQTRNATINGKCTAV